MATQIDVCNMALAHLGVSEGIQNMTTDRTPQGIYCRLFYGTVLRNVLSDVPWPFATKVQTLALVGSSGAPGLNPFNPYGVYPQLQYPQQPGYPQITFGSAQYPAPTGSNSDATEWGYTYAYPSDAIQIRRILSGIRNDVNHSRVPYRVMTVNGALTIVTDMPNALVEYTGDVENLNLVSDEFVMAFSLLLSSYIAPGLTKAQPNAGNLAFQKYQLLIGRASSSAFNEEQPDVMPESAFIRGR